MGIQKGIHADLYAFKTQWHNLKTESRMYLPQLEAYLISYSN